MEEAEISSDRGEGGKGGEVKLSAGAAVGVQKNVLVPSLIRRALTAAFEVVSTADSACVELEELIGRCISLFTLHTIYRM